MVSGYVVLMFNVTVNCNTCAMIPTPFSRSSAGNNTTTLNLEQGFSLEKNAIYILSISLNLKTFIWKMYLVFWAGKSTKIIIAKFLGQSHMSNFWYP